MSTLDIDYVRAQFPAVKEHMFFDNAGGTLVPESVITLVRDYMTRNQVQPGASYRVSGEADMQVQDGHRSICEMIHASHEEVIIGHSTTMNVYMLANAFRHELKPGDEIIVTNLDHEANIGAWRRLAEFGVAVKEWKIESESGELGGASELQKLLSEKTKLVCCTWCSNITGSINDIAEIADVCHEAGALLCVDAVAYAPHRALNMKHINADFCLFSLYKLYGPHLGVIYGKREHLVRLKGQNHFFFDENQLPAKFLVGGYQHELVASLAGISSYFKDVHLQCFGSHKSTRESYASVFELIQRHEQFISEPLVDFLLNHPRVRLFGRTEGSMLYRVPVFSFVVHGENSSALSRKLGEKGIGVNAGDFYARRCIEALGAKAYGGVVRISLVHYNSHEEVERLVKELDLLI